MSKCRGQEDRYKVGIENPVSFKNKIPHAHKTLQYWNATTGDFKQCEKQCVNDTHPVYSQGKALLTNDLDHELISKVFIEVLNNLRRG